MGRTDPAFERWPVAARLEFRPARYDDELAADGFGYYAGEPRSCAFAKDLR